MRRLLKNDLKIPTYEFSKKYEKRVQSRKKKAGKEWLRDFFKWHLILSIKQPTSVARAFVRLTDCNSKLKFLQRSKKVQSTKQQA